MALTSVLDTPNNSARVFGPGQRSNGLATALEGISNGISAFGQRSNALAGKAKASQEAEATSATNELATRAAEAMNDPNYGRQFQDRVIPGVQSNGSNANVTFSPPTDVVTNVGKLMTIQKAVTSGSVQQAYADMHTENFVLDVMHKYPDAAAETFKYAQERGLNHIAFRAYEEADKARSAAIASHQANEDDLIKKAVSIGSNPNLDRATLISIGTQANLTEYQASQVKQAQEMRTANLTIGSKEREAADLSNIDNVYQNVLVPEQAQNMDVLHANLNSFVQAIDSGQLNLQEADGAVASTLRDVGVAADSARQAQHRRIDSLGMSFAAAQQLHDRVDKDFDTFKSYRENLLTGPASQVSTNLRAYQSVQAQLGLSNAQAMPVISALVKQLGPSFLNMFGPAAPQLSPKIQKAVRDELTNVNITNADGNNHMANVIGLLSGTKQPQDIPPSETPGTLALLGHGVPQMAINISTGKEKDPVAAAQFVRAAATLFDKGNNTGPIPVADSAGASQFIGIAYSQAVADSLIKVSKTGNGEAPDVMRDGRGSAMSMLMNLSKPEILANVEGTTGWRIKFNDKTLKWEANPGPNTPKSTYIANAFQQGLVIPGSAGFVSGNAPFPQRVSGTLPTNVKNRLKDLNTLTGFVAYTRASGDEVPANATQRSYVNWVVTGGNSPLMDNKGQVITSRPQRDELRSAADKIHTMSANIVAGNQAGANQNLKTTNARAMVSSLPEDVAMALTMVGEASNNPREEAAVGETVYNRLQSGKFGKDLADVLDPKQFNAWEDPVKLQAMMDSPRFKRALQTARGIMSGDHTPVTRGATHFYAPATQRQLHQQNPKKYREVAEFDNGTGTDIGASRFFSLE